MPARAAAVAAPPYDVLSTEEARARAENKPHSFDHIRKTTGLELTDDQFVAMIDKNRGRFKLVHFVKRDDEGEQILPGRPGLRLRPDSV